MAAGVAEEVAIVEAWEFLKMTLVSRFSERVGEMVENLRVIGASTEEAEQQLELARSERQV